MNIGNMKTSDISICGAGEDFDAWLFNLLMDNNLLHSFNPAIIASHEQLAFMVHLSPEQVYLPCSDSTFRDMSAKDIPPRLLKMYARAWRIVMNLLRTMPYERNVKRRIVRFCRYRLRSVLEIHNIIPSRLIKRLTGIVLSLDEILDDPWRSRRAGAIEWQENVLARADVRAALDDFELDKMGLSSIKGLRTRMFRMEFARLACLAACVRAWSHELPSVECIRKIFFQAEDAFAGLGPELARVADGASTILLLCDADGGSVYDLALAKLLLERGHRVIYAVKDNFYFHSPTIQDVQDNPVLRRLLKGAYVCRERALSKNELLRLLREWRLLVISDGTRERLNLSRVNVTFSRAWKEADIVLAHGWRLRERLLRSSFTFTRDILFWWFSSEGLETAFKPHDSAEHKFSESEIMKIADNVIAQMQSAHDSGRTVVFYSCVIGSIPGETATAIRLVCAFTEDLRRRMPGALIINPAEHFVEGMDGDDLMYMWEQVQRSGYINIWRFQTFEDIEKSFALLGEGVPQTWLGKDSTYSTGCTKEMHIALDVEKSNPEMQIIGPSPDKFFRRSEYGVGKYFDATLVHR